MGNFLFAWGRFQKEFEEKLANKAKTHNKNFKYIRCKKPVRGLVGPLDGQEVKEALKEDKVIEN